MMPPDAFASSPLNVAAAVISILHVFDKVQPPVVVVSPARLPLQHQTHTFPAPNIDFYTHTHVRACNIRLRDQKERGERERERERERRERGERACYKREIVCAYYVSLCRLCLAL